jgi:hypothetical protein
MRKAQISHTNLHDNGYETIHRTDIWIIWCRNNFVHYEQMFWVAIIYFQNGPIWSFLNHTSENSSKYLRIQTIPHRKQLFTITQTN